MKGYLEILEVARGTLDVLLLHLILKGRDALKFCAQPLESQPWLFNTNRSVWTVQCSWKHLLINISKNVLIPAPQLFKKKATEKLIFISK